MSLLNPNDNVMITDYKAYPSVLYCVSTSNSTRRRNMTYRATDRDRDGDLDKLSVTAAVDRVRWASVLAGVFTVFASLAFFTILGVALGLSTIDLNNPRSFAIGASIYAAVSAILAFGLGGFISARTTAVAGTGNAILNGAMVWIVVIPIIVNVLTTGVGSLLGTAVNVAGSAAGTAVDVASNVAGDVADEAAGAATQVANDPQLQATAEALATEAIEQVGTAVQDVTEQIDEPEEQEEIARDLSRPAWGALLALGLSAAAAIIGGMAGRRTYPTDVAVLADDRTRNG
jgi:hypothetical protein